MIISYETAFANSASDSVSTIVRDFESAYQEH
ncbi:unnamed protein product, partial [Rotaria magnacalcarata]